MTALQKYEGVHATEALGSLGSRGALTHASPLSDGIKINGWVVSTQHGGSAATTSFSSNFFLLPTSFEFPQAGSRLNAPGVPARPQDGTNGFHARFERTLKDLGRLVDGWAGEGSLAPSEAILLELETVAVGAIPNDCALPEVEVEDDTGAVTLRWTSENRDKQISMFLGGTGTVILVAVDIDAGVAESPRTFEASPEGLRGLFRAIQEFNLPR
ncbi:hypothetical protein [Maricaulis sp. CAU 1757]